MRISKGNRNFNLIYSKRNKFNKNQINLFVGKWILNKTHLKEKEYEIEIYNHHWLNKKKKIKRLSICKKNLF